MNPGQQRHLRGYIANLIKFTAANTLALLNDTGPHHVLLQIF